MAHTPGPWLFQQAPNPRDERLKGYEITAETENGKAIIAEIHTQPRLAVIRAENARLIAAAPDLLEACKDALSYFEHEFPAGGGTVEVLLDAVAKAEPS